MFYVHICKRNVIIKWDNKHDIGILADLDLSGVTKLELPGITKISDDGMQRIIAAYNENKNKFSNITEISFPNLQHAPAQKADFSVFSDLRDINWNYKPWKFW